MGEDQVAAARKSAGALATASSSSSSPPPPPPPPPRRLYVYGTLFAWIQLSTLLIFINKQILGFTTCRLPFLLALLHMATGGLAASVLVGRLGGSGAARAAASSASEQRAAALQELQLSKKLQQSQADPEAALDDLARSSDDDNNNNDGGSSDSSSQRPLRQKATAASRRPSPPPSPSSSTADFYALQRDYFGVAALLAGALLCANGAFMHLSIPMIQMLKAGSPVVIFFAGIALGSETFSGVQLFNVLLICAGVFCSAYASVDLHLLGMAFQCAAIVCDSLRMSLLQRTMARAGVKMNPMAALAEFAPRAALLLLLPTLLIDAPLVWKQHQCLVQTWPLLGASCAVAFLLNVAVCALIGATSALTTSISGMLKDVVVVCLSIAMHGVRVTPLQWGGYGIALSALAWHHYRSIFGGGGGGGGGRDANRGSAAFVATASGGGAIEQQRPQQQTSDDRDANESGDGHDTVPLLPKTQQRQHQVVAMRFGGHGNSKGAGESGDGAAKNPPGAGAAPTAPM